MPEVLSFDSGLLTIQYIAKEELSIAWVKSSYGVDALGDVSHEPFCTCNPIYHALMRLG